MATLRLIAQKHTLGKQQISKFLPLRILETFENYPAVKLVKLFLLIQTDGLHFGLGPQEVVEKGARKVKNSRAETRHAKLG